MEVNKVICEDCLEEMKKMKDNSVDLILTDPPYGQKIKKNYRSNEIEKWDLDFDIIPYFNEFKRIIKEDGMIYIFCNQHNINNLPKSNLILVWDKNDYDVGDTRIWSCSHEFIKVYKFGIANFKYNKRPIGILKIAKVQNARSEEFKKGIFSNCQVHPTQKPMKLIREILKHHKVNNVLDPFAGSGTTGVVAKQLGINYILIEKEQKYVNIIKKRLKQQTL